MSSVIQVKDLTKNFGEITAVSNLNFTVNTCEVYGFLGQNGAGKSTTIRMLLTLIEPTEGDIEIFGYSLNLHRKFILKRIGAIVEKPDLYKYLTAIENLCLVAKLSGIRLSRARLLEKLENVGLASRADSRISSFSQGMKQRLGIAVALVHDPDLVILDEPMNGLDPQGIADIRNLIVHLSKDLKKTVFISSHILSEMELVADSLLIIDNGKKIVEGNLQQLLKPETTNVEIESSSSGELLEHIRRSKWAGSFVSVNGGKLILRIGQAEVPELIAAVSSFGIPLYSIRPRHSLEDYFLSLTLK